jgi:hypothetical protein
MTHTTRWMVAGAISLAVFGCSESSTSARTAIVSADLTTALATAPPGFSATLNTFDASMDPGPDTWVPHANALAAVASWSASGFMGGGLSPEFFGADAFSLGVSVPPFDNDADHDADDSQCTFAASTGIETCGPVTRHGLTVTETIAYTDTAGKAQQTRNGATNAVETTITAGGTITRGFGDAERVDTTTVKFASDRKVTGVAHGSTSRTVNSTSGGTETTTGVSDSTHFSSTRTIGDTTSGLVVPVMNGRPTYPTAGTVIRSMSVLVTMGTSTPTTASRREVITYDGTNVAKVVITKNGVTQNCTLPLPHGKLTCA